MHIDREKMQWIYSLGHSIVPILFPDLVQLILIEPFSWIVQLELIVCAKRHNSRKRSSRSKCRLKQGSQCLPDGWVNAMECKQTSTKETNWNFLRHNKCCWTAHFARHSSRNLTKLSLVWPGCVVCKWLLTKLQFNRFCIDKSGLELN